MSYVGGIVTPVIEPLAWDARLQQLLNARPVPARFTDAGHPPPLVRARLLWSREGEEWLITEAWAWTRHLVLVYVPDTRVQTNGVWLPITDVARHRPSAAGESRHRSRA